MRMRVLASLAVSASALMFCNNAMADADSGTGRYLSDPAYLPLQGEFDGSTSFSISDSRANVYNSTGAFSAHLFDQSDIIAQSFHYGITDDLTVNLTDSYLPFDKRSRTDALGVQTSRNRQGITDPSIGLTWRAIDQGESPVNFDVFASYSPDWVNSRAATAASDGSEGRGGQAGTVGVALSHVTPVFTVYGALSANLVGHRDTFDPVSGTVASRGGSTGWNLDLATQTRLSDTISFNAGIAQSLGRSHTDVIGPAGIEHLDDPASSTTLHLAANYTFVPNRLVGSLSYAHDFDGTSHTDFPATPANDTTARGRQGNVLGLHLDYAFN